MNYTWAWAILVFLSGCVSITAGPMRGVFTPHHPSELSGLVANDPLVIVEWPKDPAPTCSGVDCVEVRS